MMGSGYASTMHSSETEDPRGTPRTWFVRWIWGRTEKKENIIQVQTRDFLLCQACNWYNSFLLKNGAVYAHRTLNAYGQSVFIGFVSGCQVNSIPIWKSLNMITHSWPWVRWSCSLQAGPRCLRCRCSRPCHIASRCVCGTQGRGRGLKQNRWNYCTSFFYLFVIFLLVCVE